MYVCIICFIIVFMNKPIIFSCLVFILFIYLYLQEKMKRSRKRSSTDSRAGAAGPAAGGAMPAAAVAGEVNNCLRVWCVCAKPEIFFFSIKQHVNISTANFFVYFQNPLGDSKAGLRFKYQRRDSTDDVRICVCNDQKSNTKIGILFWICNHFICSTSFCFGKARPPKRETCELMEQIIRDDVMDVVREGQ